MAEEFNDNPFFNDDPLDDGLFPPADASDSPPSSSEGAGGEQPSADQLAQMRLEAQTLQRFNQDPEFARHVIETRARQLGLSVQTPQAQPTKPADAPQEYVETVRASLPQELQFLAPHIAKATWTATEARIAPLTRAQQEQSAQARQTSYDSMARDLSEEAPGWEKFEDSMLEILGFLRNAMQGEGPMTHPKHGSALKLLYRLAAGDGQATAQAGRRMQQALRNGTRTSMGGQTRNNGPSVERMISEAKSSQDKWGIAFRHALREHGLS